MRTYSKLTAVAAAVRYKLEENIQFTNASQRQVSCSARLLQLKQDCKKRRIFFLLRCQLSRGDLSASHQGGKDDVLGHKDRRDEAAFIDFGRFYAKSYT
jgi:hypothetical protein